MSERLDRLQCRCGRGDTIRRPPGYCSPVDLVTDYAGVSAIGFPVGWRVYQWRDASGVTVHTESVCPDCPDPTGAEEVSRA